jgi:acetyl esterase/lipase
MFPDHPRDVGEALGWLDRNLHVFNGNPRRIMLIGHSAGAHLAALLATQPRYAKRWGVRRKQLRGFVSLDTPSFDIAAGADPQTSLRPEEGRLMFWNAFGTPQENRVSGDWTAASPSVWADRGDPAALLVTQAGNEQRLADHRAMALALQRPPARTVLSVALDHREINRVLGPDGDEFGVTAAVRAFARRVLGR